MLSSWARPSIVPAEVVAAHLAACPDCRKVVAGLSGAQGGPLDRFPADAQPAGRHPQLDPGLAVVPAAGRAAGVGPPPRL